MRIFNIGYYRGTKLNKTENQVNFLFTSFFNQQSLAIERVLQEIQLCYVGKFYVKTNDWRM